VGIVPTWRAPKPRWLFVLALAETVGALQYNIAQPHFDRTALVTYNDQQKTVVIESIISNQILTK